MEYDIWLNAQTRCLSSLDDVCRGCVAEDIYSMANIEGKVYLNVVCIDAQLNFEFCLRIFRIRK